MKCLNLGAGEKIKKSTENEEWINLDIRKLEGIDIICDLSKEKIPLEDNSIDYILANDILEHFTPKELVEILSECNRILKEGGKIEIKTPDLEKIILAYPNVIDSYELDRKIFGERDYPQNQHKIGFTKESLMFYLSICGFKILNIKPGTLADWSNMICYAEKPNLDRWVKLQIESYSEIKRSKDILTTPRAKIAIDLIKKYNPQKILDIGCQDGWLERELRKENYTNPIVGLDLPEVIKNYDYSDIQNFKVIGKNIEEGIPKEQKYDCICCFEILEHLIHPYKILKQIREIIEENGILLITTPNGKEGMKHTTHFNWYDARRMQILLKLTGFRLDEIYPIPEILFAVARPC